MGFEEIAKFIKDWIPPIGIIGAGCWALYRWISTEKLREVKERTSLEGTLDCSYVEISDKTCLIMFTAAWKNLSPLPVEVDTKTTVLDVYKIDSGLQVGGMRA
jgi:hypothetical protein